MGGVGSGRLPGRSHRGPGEGTQKKITTQLLSVDVRAAKREGTIAPGQQHIYVSGNPKLLPREVEIELDWTPCNFGASRPWLLCPGCARRVAILYLQSGRLLCRTCLGLIFPSQTSAARRQLRERQKT